MPDKLGTDKIGDVAALSGSQPSETGPGSTGGTAMGGGKAVPDNDVLMGGDSALDDSGSMDDGIFNNGDSLAEEGKATATPQMSPDGPDKSPKNADAPTGGLGGTSSVGR
ncbi:MAG: hypothetical protein ACRYFS_02295 [Janthinobacterium lividum]